MLSTAIIFFREIFEIAIILSITMAATRGVAGRGKWVLAGIGGGMLGAALVALFAEELSQMLKGVGQEVFNAGVLFTAVLMIGWTVVWMKKHGRELSTKFIHTGKQVSSGVLPVHALAILVSLSMWREGAEIVLFMFGVLSSTQDSIGAIVFGGALGGISAAVIGTLLYFGLITLPMRHLFSFTGMLLTLLACGMSAQAASYLSSAGLLPEMGAQLWDSSHILSTSSPLGYVMHSLLGYTERPSGMQLAFYLSTLAVILGLSRHQKIHASA